MCLVLAFAMIAQDVNAQALYGTLTGSVKDSSGGAIPGVEVTASNATTNLSATAISKRRWKLHPSQPSERPPTHCALF